MKIYTRTGDRGETSLFGGKRVSKASIRVEAYGTVDELNSAIGLAIAEMQNSKVPTPLKLRGTSKRQKYKLKIKNELEQIQHDLFDIGAALATPRSIKHESRITHLDQRVSEFEKLIDEMTEKLPELRNFILPGGGKAGSLLHFARTVCRRAERRIISFSQKEHVDGSIIKYFNRLSDLLFTMARFANYKEGKREIKWLKQSEK